MDGSEMSAQDKRQQRGNLRVEEESQGASQTLAAWKTSGGQRQHKHDPRVMRESKQAPNPRALCWACGRKLVQSERLHGEDYSGGPKTRNGTKSIECGKRQLKSGAQNGSQGFSRANCRRFRPFISFPLRVGTQLKC